MTRVAVLDDYQERAHDFANWSSLGPDVQVSFFRDPMSEEDLVRALADFDVISLMRERTRFPKSLLERLPKLRLLVTTGLANAAVDTDFLHERGITFTGTGQGGAGASMPKGVGGPVELTWALIFALVKRTLIEDRAMRTGSWQLGFPTNVAGTTLGLAGLGRLGGAMVDPARVFGMSVIAWSENLTDERAKEFDVERVSKEELLRRADVLSIHLVLSDRTRGLFGKHELGLMKPSAVLINTSRGPIIVEDALVDALRSGQIAGAGLDVYDQEPLPKNHPLLLLDNTVLAPHVGYVSEIQLRDWYAQVVENIKAFLKGDPIRVIA